MTDTQKTALQTALQTAYETTFGESKLPLATGGKDFPIRLDELTDRQNVAFLRYGKRALNDAYNSEAKAARDDGETLPDPQEFFTEWLEAFGTNKPRGGGARLSPEVAGWIEYFKSKASPVKFKGEIPNGKNLDKFQTAFVRKAIWPSVRKAIANLTQEEQRDFHKDKLPGLIEQHKAEVLQKAERNQEGVGGFITAERKKRNQISDTFAVEIDIDL